ncbi:hypothetical protein BWQ96_06292 [Gracilariopsis chorda]|uniref:No apical meristem-associated C-terminal domain-containing protein n=1 Tax=Gracilariopsis chorda TaxID=448386 RepID=A0A2V3IPH8_9FLOR|nr:hypothetical protein BWQ96_06292 [Gracilariopsis chorda]|eukprot:PXF43982.1 hypothetical protein BWQ96_06292 [Gracilariopsis chorda]
MIAIADVYRAFDRSAGVPIGPKFKYVKVWEWMTEGQLLLDVRQSTQNLASFKEDVNVPLCAEMEGFAKPVENLEQLDDVGKGKNIDSAGVKTEGETNSTNCVAKKNDSRPMGTKKAKLEARLIASLDEGARGIKRLSEDSFESNSIKKKQLERIMVTNHRKQQYLLMKDAREEERHQLSLLSTNISEDLKEKILARVEKSLMKRLDTPKGSNDWNNPNTLASNNDSAISNDPIRTPRDSTSSKVGIEVLID